MSPSLGIIIMMNNYFHDVATALLLASAIALWTIVRKVGDDAHASVIEYSYNVFRGLAKLARLSIAWIIIGGIPRLIYYQDFEWANAAGKNQIPALIVKHIFFFIFVGSGAHLWLKLKKRMNELKNHVQY